jgi:hypothetical protein
VEVPVGDLLSTLAAWAQVAAIPVAIVAIVVSIVLFRRGRQRRQLSCIFHPLTFPVEIKAGEALHGDIEIRYRGQPVANLFVARVTVRNTGTLPITNQDVINPVAFSFREGTQLVREPTIVSRRPPDLAIRWSYDAAGEGEEAAAVEAKFDLMNPGDDFTAEFTCTGPPRAPSLTARIVGVAEVSLLDAEELRLKREINSALIFGGPGLVAGVALLTVSDRVPGATTVIPLAIGTGMGILFQGLSPALRLRRYRKSKGP